jgi:hypothetical protein
MHLANDQCIPHTLVPPIAHGPPARQAKSVAGSRSHHGADRRHAEQHGGREGQAQCKQQGPSVKTDLSEARD